MLTDRDLRKAVPGDMFKNMDDDLLLETYKKTSRAKSILKSELKRRGVALSDAQL